MISRILLVVFGTLFLGLLFTGLMAGTLGAFGVTWDDESMWGWAIVVPCMLVAFTLVLREARR